ncbi:cryptochrome/photolyase family protein [Phaeovulum sp.]|uniref:cryptochrome/photolyase family protein n=1 Tax=Phaeovulum sp. TaxID=2934796 RepID=UPI0039E3A32E
MPQRPIILWLRRDLRLLDHPALAAAVASGRPVIPVFIHDEAVAALGAAARWRMGQGVARFAETLARAGSRLILRRGPAGAVLRELVKQVGAVSVYWSRSYDPAWRPRDTALKAGLQAAGTEARSFEGALLFEPWDVTTGQGGPYRVYTPYWNSVRRRDLAQPQAAPHTIRAPELWPPSDALADWAMGAQMRRGAAVLARHAQIGEAAAQARLANFVQTRIQTYKERRDFPAQDATSGLSENLTYGEISPLVVWHAGRRALYEGAAGAEHFLKELVWREFAWHLYHHYPALSQANWREGWDAFPWRGDNPDAEAWRRGMTGVPFVDAAMRELYVTGTMHNRARMIAASYLTKHLLTDWRIGLKWFEDTLIDWDPAANAMGWQWMAGSGPDASPYFRVFNPAGQAEKFDREGTYRNRFIAEGQRDPPQTASEFFAAIPESWGMNARQPYPEPRITLEDGRARALLAYEAREK